MDRKILKASEGKILTDGNTYGRTIYLAEGVDEKVFYEITQEEYEKIMAESEASVGE